MRGWHGKVKDSTAYKVSEEIKKSSPYLVKKTSRIQGREANQEEKCGEAALRSERAVQRTQI